MLRLFRNRRRRAVMARPFPDAWRESLRRMRLYRILDENERVELRRKVAVFLDEQRFEGCAGLELTDEIRVTIAAQACLLLLGRPDEHYPRLGSILVYPDRYIAPMTQRMPDGSLASRPQTRLGEAWLGGNVVLSWRDAERGAVDAHDGHNVILHEFAHTLDGADKNMNGTPRLEHKCCYASWARVLGGEFTTLRRNLRSGRISLLHPYAATNPAEFFAVSTETFFEQPNLLREHHPELYKQLSHFYRQDPAERVHRSGALP
jgi:Mlc titration factor MtfA (ptsG expression regulator)